MMMNKNIKISLNTKDISDMIKKLTELEKDYQKFPEKLVDEISKDALTYLDMQYANTSYNEDIEDINTDREETVNGYRIFAEGKDVIYAEFGSGDEGAINPHPEKSNYPLNAYNSGKTIRSTKLLSPEKMREQNLKPGKYWTYKKDGVKKYTQGIPAGKQVFNTRNYIKDVGIKKAKDKLVGDMLSKL